MLMFFPMYQCQDGALFKWSSSLQAQSQQQVETDNWPITAGQVCSFAVGFFECVYTVCVCERECVHMCMCVQVRGQHQTFSPPPLSVQGFVIVLDRLQCP